MQGKITTNGTSKCINIKKPFNHCSASLSLFFLQPSCQIPFRVSGEQETFNKTSLIEFQRKWAAWPRLCSRSLLLAIKGAPLLSETCFVKKAFFSQAKHPIVPLASGFGPEAAKSEASRSAEGSRESLRVKSDQHVLHWEPQELQLKEQFTYCRLELMQLKLVHWSPGPVCFSHLKYQGVSNSGWTKSIWKDENKHSLLYIRLSPASWSTLDRRQTEHETNHSPPDELHKRCFMAF